tara:strand:- start:318 stop:572 length:255 start_codon:yes stop_codon:yes gene_type:complete
MELAMNELEAMKSSYKKVLKGHQTAMSLGNPLAESERSTGNLEKTMSSYSNFSSKKKELKEKLNINNLSNYNNEYKSDELRMTV